MKIRDFHFYLHKKRVEKKNSNYTPEEFLTFNFFFLSWFKLLLSQKNWIIFSDLFFLWFHISIFPLHGRYTVSRNAQRSQIWLVFISTLCNEFEDMQYIVLKWALFEDRARRARKVLPDGPDWQCYLAND